MELMRVEWACDSLTFSTIRLSKPPTPTDTDQATRYHATQPSQPICILNIAGKEPEERQANVMMDNLAT